MHLLGKACDCQSFVDVEWVAKNDGVGVAEGEGERERDRRRITL